MNQRNDKDQWDIIIVGAGICGLSLGALLVNDGYRVLILEKSKQIGGRARVMEKKGFTLDYGIHMVRFGKKSALAKTLKTIKVKNQKTIKFKEIGISYYYLETEGDTHWEVLPLGLTGATKGDYFSISKLKNILFKLMMAKKKKNLAVSVENWKKKKKIKEEGNLYLKLITASMQVCPFLERASMGELRRNLAEVIKKRISATYPVGGWKLIFNRLVEKIETNGKILTNYKVEDIITEKQLEAEKYRVIAVKSGEKIFNGKKIVLSPPVQELFNFLNEELCEPDFVQLCKNLRPTGGLSLDIALEKKISDATGLFYFENPLAFGIFTSNLDLGSAPEDKQLFTICSPCNVEDLENQEFRDDLLAKLRNKLFQAFPDMKNNVIFERPLFTIFDGVEVNIKQYQELRPYFKVPGIQNLYLVGDSTAGKGAGGDIGHNSVWKTYDLIKEEKK